MDHRRPGRLAFPDGDETALAEGMLHAYEAREKLKEMRIAARTLAEERADWNKNFQKLLEAYDMAYKRAK